jgi:hypothetical protein
MNWYAAHIVLVVKYKRGSQKSYPAWENVVLIRANSENDAFTKAEEAGLRDATDDDGSFRWRGRAARWEFAGVRKIVELALRRDRPSAGDELTYNELEFDSLSAVQKFVQNLPVQLKIDEQVRYVDEPSAKRKHA